MTGVWMKEGKGDVHIYLDEQNQFVIGHNKNHATMKFTPLALVISQNNKHSIQLDINGEPKTFDLAEETVKQALLGFLNTLKGLVC